MRRRYAYFEARYSAPPPPNFLWTHIAITEFVSKETLNDRTLTQNVPDTEDAGAAYKAFKDLAFAEKARLALVLMISL